MPTKPNPAPALRAAWSLAIVIAIADCLWIPLAGFRAPLAPLVRIAGILFGLGVLWWIYMRLRPDAIIAALVEAAAFLIIFTLGLEILCYLALAFNRPLWDPLIATADKALGFDFRAHLAFLVRQPHLARLLELCYNTSMLQIAVAVVSLAISGRFARLRIFLSLFAFTASVVIGIAALFPTLGPYSYFTIPDGLLPAFADPRAGWNSVPQILALRDGSLRVLPLTDLRGLVSFPSFHTALALIILWAVLPIRSLFLLLLPINLLLVVGAPSNGDHYLCDLLGGAFIAIVAIAALRGSALAGAPHSIASARGAVPAA